MGRGGIDAVSSPSDASPGTCSPWHRPVFTWAVGQDSACGSRRLVYPPILTCFALALVGRGLRNRPMASLDQQAHEHRQISRRYFLRWGGVAVAAWNNS